jgi:metal-responsive CopG/Arc/MetJ family transcriptional regulator
LRGKDVSSYFTNRGRMMEPLSGVIGRVDVDFTAEMLQELDSAAGRLNISRQAVIKTLLRQALDQHYLAEGARQKAG